MITGTEKPSADVFGKELVQAAIFRIEFTAQLTKSTQPATIGNLCMMLRHSTRLVK